FLVVDQGCHPRRILVAPALEIPSLLLAMYGFHRSAGTTAVQGGPLSYDAKKEELINSLQLVPTRVIAGWSGNAAYWIVIGLALVWMAVLLTARTDATDSEA